MGYQSLQQVGDGSVGCAGRAGDVGDLGGRVSAGDGQQAVEHQRSDLGIRAGAVGLTVVKAKAGGQCRQVVFRKGGQEYGRQIPRVVIAVGEREMVGPQKPDVESYVVADDGQIADEICELVSDLIEGRSAFDLCLADGRELLNERRDPSTRVDERLVAIKDFAASKTDGSQLDDGVGVSVEAGGLEVDTDKLVLERVEPSTAEDGCLGHSSPPVIYAVRMR